MPGRRRPRGRRQRGRRRPRGRRRLRGKVWQRSARLCKQQWACAPGTLALGAACRGCPRCPGFFVLDGPAMCRQRPGYQELA
eukprot:362704-Chlamydomonas_euryale.AAC.1